MGSLCIFLDPDTMAKEIASQLEKCASQTEKDGRIFTLVLSGGSTDPVLYGKLAEPKWRDRIPWKSVHIFFVDERCVPPENEESNYGICCRVLLDHIAIPNSNIHRIRGEEDPVSESTRYAKEIQDHMIFRKGQGNFFDWVFLGVGTDGHTASLFPGQNIINSPKLCEVARHPDTGQLRITMTPAAIELSSRITYHCIGEEKSEIVFKLASDPSATNIYPALRIQGEWFLDKSASAKFDFS